MDMIEAILGITITILITLLGAIYWLGRKFAEIDMRFKMIDERFKQVDKRFEEIERRMEERFGQMNRRLEALEYRVQGLEERVDRVEASIKEISSRMERLENRMSSLERRVESGFKILSSMTTEMNTAIIDFLATKHLVEREEAEYLKRRVEGIAKVMKSALNPLTKEEIEFLAYVFSKDLDDITIEEMDKAYELGLKLLLEDWDYRGYIIAIASRFIRGYLISKKAKEEKKKKEAR